MIKHAEDEGIMFFQTVFILNTLHSFIPEDKSNWVSRFISYEGVLISP